MSLTFFANKEFTHEDILNKGLKYAMEFGPTFGQPIQDRLSRKYPSLSQSQLDEYENSCRETMNDGCKYVYNKLEILNKKMHTISPAQLEIDFRKFTQAKYSWIDESNFRGLLNKAWYFAMHDGLDTVIK